MEEYEDTHVVVSEREALISTVSYNIMATNDLACATVIFALFRLKEKSLLPLSCKAVGE